MEIPRVSVFKKNRKTYRDQYQNRWLFRSDCGGEDRYEGYRVLFGNWTSDEVFERDATLQLQSSARSPITLYEIVRVAEVTERTQNNGFKIAVLVEIL